MKIGLKQDSNTDQDIRILLVMNSDIYHLTLWMPNSSFNSLINIMEKMTIVITNINFLYGTESS